MKIPKAVRVLNYPYTVAFKEGLIDPDKRGAIGQTNERELTINLDSTQHPAAIGSTFIHELLHAVDWHYFEQTLFSDDEREKKICLLAEGLCQVLSDMGVTFET